MGVSKWLRRLKEWLEGKVAPSPEPAVAEGKMEREESWKKWKMEREQREEERRCTESVQG